MRSLVRLARTHATQRNTAADPDFDDGGIDVFRRVSSRPGQPGGFYSGLGRTGAGMGAGGGVKAGREARALNAGREEMVHEFSPPRELTDRVCYARAVSFFPDGAGCSVFL